MDAKLNSIDDLLPSPSRYTKVGNKSHDGYSKKPARKIKVQNNKT